jgi:hypothetical protein
LLVLNMATQKPMHRKPAASAQPSLQSVVGERTYEVWLDMLRILVPGGRTHRLAAMLAGMLRYAVEQSTRKGRRHRPSRALVEALIALDEGDDDATVLVTAAVQRLFRDAGVRAARASRNGESYSIVDAAIHEFQRWGDMPWE